jgi:hypothetical protein
MCFACSPFAGALAGAMSRRAVLQQTAAGCAWAGIAGAMGGFACNPAEAATESGDTLYTGGPIIAIDDTQPVAEAVLVRAGRIVAVGPRAAVESQAKGPIATVDLNGKALLPGFVDPHGHVVMVGLQALAANLLPAPDGEGNDIAALQRILGGGWAGTARSSSATGSSSASATTTRSSRNSATRPARTSTPFLPTRQS